MTLTLNKLTIINRKNMKKILFIQLHSSLIDPRFEEIPSPGLITMRMGAVKGIIVGICSCSQRSC